MNKFPLGLFVCLVFNVTVATAGEINTTNGVAIGGYDPIGYFDQGKAVKGDQKFQTEWRGAQWHFSSAKNRDRFVTNPEKYAPQFGGHCANGLSEGHKVPGSPNIWRIIDGKLYMFFAERGRKRWEEKTEQWIKDANRTWRELKNE